VRENGGQYTHAAMWTVIALARLGMGDEAMELFHMINPINHARTGDGVDRYRTEPFAVAADVYAHPMHIGRGGWTWYTGSAGWMYQAAVRALLGIRRHGTTMSVTPSIPSVWPQFSVVWRLGGTRYRITVSNPEHRTRGIKVAELDGARVDPGAIPLVDDGGVHDVQIVMGHGGNVMSAAGMTTAGQPEVRS
jgi:cyclic beta-1,2-glucan synthetase